MDNVEFGMGDRRIIDGEVNRNGLGVAKKVAVGAGVLAAGSGAFVLGCKGAKAAGLIKPVAEGADPTFLQKVSDFQLSSVGDLFKSGKLGTGTTVGAKLGEWFGQIGEKLGGDEKLFGKLFGTMSNYPILGAAGLAGAGFFITKAVKKLVNKIRGVDEQGYSR